MHSMKKRRCVISSQAFYYTHVYGFCIYILFAIMHYKPLTSTSLPALVMYCMDRAFRYWQLASNWTAVHCTDVGIEDRVMTIVLKWSKVGPEYVLPGNMLAKRMCQLTYVIGVLHRVDGPACTGHSICHIHHSVNGCTINMYHHGDHSISARSIYLGLLTFGSPGFVVLLCLQTRGIIKPGIP